MYENYEIRPPDWVDAEGTVNLRIVTHVQVHLANLGDIAYGASAQNRKTPIVFYGESEFPQRLSVEFSTWMTESWMTGNVNSKVVLPSP